MKILEILCHPKPGSFTHHLALKAADELSVMGHEVAFHDLYAEQFGPLLDQSELARGYSLDELVQAHCRELSACDGLLVFHPDWWGQPPALLTGWIDRVFRQGVAYELEGEDSSEKNWRPLLTGKKGLVFCTSDAEESAPRTLEPLWEKAVLGRCGMEAACHVIRGLRGAGPAARREWEQTMVRSLREWFPGRARL